MMMIAMIVIIQRIEAKLWTWLGIRDFFFTFHSMQASQIHLYIIHIRIHTTSNGTRSEEEEEKKKNARIDATTSGAIIKRVFLIETTPTAVSMWIQKLNVINRKKQIFFLLPNYVRLYALSTNKLELHISKCDMITLK